MTNEAALYQILFQDDTLFRIGEPEVTHRSAEPKSEKPVAEPVLPTTPSIAPPNIAISVNNQIPFPTLKHRILILADEPKSKEINNSERTLLTNILKAVGHSIDEVDMLNFSQLESKDARIVLAEKRTNFFITFGVPLIKLNLDLLLPPYTPKQIEGIWFLLADPLAVVEADVNVKKKLWLALKAMFPNT